MRILNVSNHSSTRCGIQAFGAQMTTALRRAGAEVTDWDGEYSSVYRNGYLPMDCPTYDVIHVNWHPITINHYLPIHFPTGPLLSVYVNDLPPWSGCPIWDRADIRLASEVYPGTSRLVYPVVDWVPDLPEPNPTLTIGTTGVRNDGTDEIQQAVEARGWIFNGPSPTWLSLEEEIRRLARSTVNLLWYTNNRGISGGSMTALASRRPLVINGSTMFDHLDGFAQVWRRREGGVGQALDALPIWVADWDRTRVHDATESYAWQWAARWLLATWKAAR